MKMAKPSERDIEAGGNLMALLNDIDSGYYPFGKDDDAAPMFFDEDDPKHLRQFYDAVKATLDSAPGWQGRVIGGMCYVIMYDKNEIVDPESDTIDLHPKIVKALQAVDAHAEQAAAVRAAVLEEAAKLIDTKVYNYQDECGSYDHTTGVTEYPGNGAEWICEMEELAEEIRDLAAPSTATSNDTGALGEKGAEA